MPEYRTKPLNRQSLLNELAFVSNKLMQTGIDEVQVSFGWDSNLPIDDMWQEHGVKVDKILEFVRQAEETGIVEVGRGDIFVKTQDFSFTLCREADAHVEGTADLVGEMVERWGQFHYQPYGLKQQV
jgi:hypothetical protein